MLSDGELLASAERIDAWPRFSALLGACPSPRRQPGPFFLLNHYAGTPSKPCYQALNRSHQGYCALAAPAGARGPPGVVAMASRGGSRSTGISYAERDELNRLQREVEALLAGDEAAKASALVSRAAGHSWLAVMGRAGSGGPLGRERSPKGWREALAGSGEPAAAQRQALPAPPHLRSPPRADALPAARCSHIFTWHRVQPALTPAVPHALQVQVEAGLLVAAVEEYGSAHPEVGAPTTVVGPEVGAGAGWVPASHTVVGVLCRMHRTGTCSACP